MCNCKQKEYVLIPELETALNSEEAYSRVRSYSSFQNEFENTGTNIAAKPKTIWLNNTDLNGPCFAGNFNFLYDGGADEAIITFNTKINFRENFSRHQKSDFIYNLNEAAKMWDNAAEIQMKDTQGNFTRKIRLRFNLAIVTNAGNANKITDVHKPGTRAIPIIIQKDREIVSRQMNVFINSDKYVLAHELGHVWGLSDEYKDRGASGWLNMKFSPCHIGTGSPYINDKISIMNEGYSDASEFRTRFFLHFGRTILSAFWNSPVFIRPVIHNGKRVARSIQARVALLKKNLKGEAPFTNNMPYNPLYTPFQIAKLR